MLKMPEGDIRDFILIRYQRAELDNKPYWKEIDESCLRDYLSSQSIAFENMTLQIHKFYPRSTIHVLTNDPDFSNYQRRGIEIHLRDFPPNHTAKYLLYGLLDRPSMYLDVDIILLRRFPPHLLRLDCPFTVFAETERRDLQFLSSQQLPAATDVIYNGGVVWIGRPDKLIVEKMQSIQRCYFDDRELIESQNCWFMNDEYVISVYMSLIQHFPTIDPNVNIFRHLITRDNFEHRQSIHYTGLEQKSLLLKEWDEIHSDLLRKKRSL